MQRGLLSQRQVGPQECRKNATAISFSTLRLKEDVLKTANESLHISPLSLSEANQNATSQMCNKCTVPLMEPVLHA